MPAGLTALEDGNRLFACMPRFIARSSNPNRAWEIWQYISIINTALMSYSWDNVYHYDTVFRQLMEFNPNRSWAVTYNQMWNLLMINPLTNTQFASKRSGNMSTTNNVNQYNNASRSRKVDYCWSFNKGLKCRFGRKCKFIERCSYCNDPAHGVVNCNKLEKKDKEAKMNNGFNSGHRNRSKYMLD